MRVFPYKEVEAKEVAEDDAHRLKVRWLIAKETGAPNFAMRLFEMEPGGHSPLHMHPWEHEVFILEGEGVMVGQNSEGKIAKDDVVFVAPDELHQFRNNSNVALRFLCIVPTREK